MADEDTRLPSRRALLAAAGGAAVAIGANALGRPTPAAATHGDVHLGGTNQTDNVTTIENTWTSGDAIRGVAPDIGVRGEGATGVSGTSGSAAGSGVFGKSTGAGFGVSGISNALATSAPAAAPGPLGSPQNAVGVYGESKYGTGVKAVAEQRSAVHAIGGLWGVVAEGTQNGVFAKSAGVAVSAEGAGPGAFAIGASGRVSFSTAGLTTVPTGAKNRTITPGIDIHPASRILCTLESNQAGLSIQRFTKNTTADTFKVFLNVAVQSGRFAKISWFVIG